MSTQWIDGPQSPYFTPLPLPGTRPFDTLTQAGTSERMQQAAVDHAPRGPVVAWGIPFQAGEQALLVAGEPQRIPIEPLRAGWLVFNHSADTCLPEPNAHGFVSPARGTVPLNELAAVYVLEYEDGSEARAEIRMRQQIDPFKRRWGENCFQAVPGAKPYTLPSSNMHKNYLGDWGYLQTRAAERDEGAFTSWLWAWQNPHPEKAITALRFEPGSVPVLVSGASAGTVIEQPLRWERRRKAVLRLPEGMAFEPLVDDIGRLPQIQLDLGQVISAQPRMIYPEAGWPDSYNNQVPEISKTEILVEYTAHPQACFHLWDGCEIPVAQVEDGVPGLPLEPVAPASQRVMLWVVEKGSGRPVAVKLHMHGAAGEYLAPVDRHRIINACWFEDYSTDFLHGWAHPTTYISGETLVDLPLGTVYVEVSKGFEIRPVRQVIDVQPGMELLEIAVEKVLPWRERGWVTADTHVHFLSTGTALLEGAGEGVNVVNLLASQWGELMTNVGDFDGHTTWGAGGGPEQNGEYLVRVGTENRQHVLGHISLLGYRGRIIAPMTTGGPGESALGDPVEVLLTEWARQCKAQGGLVVLPHFPNPRAEHAASVISGDIDAVEMTSWGDLYSGIDPYSLSDWYRYLNCGYKVAAVGGTDKMSAGTAVGTVRTYARLPDGQPFIYEAWMEAVRRAETFVTYGPLLDFAVDGKPMGSRIDMPAGGGTVDVTWQVASVTVPASRVELIVNGEVRESAPLEPGGGAGSWRVRLERSAWLALLVRGGYPGKPEIIAAHSSPVMVQVTGSELLAAADAVTILEQIEGALAFLDTVGTRAEDRAYKRMRLVLQSAQRALHNRMHEKGYYHEHNIKTEHDG